MAEALVEILLQNLTTLLKGEFGLLFDFEKEFQKLSRTFSRIQDVLADAEVKQVNDKTIENWLKDLNAAAYQVDDILDECKTEAIRLKQSRLGRYHPRIISFRHKIGMKMKEIMEKLDEIAEEKSKFHFHERSTERKAVRRETGSISSELEVYGRVKEGDEIVNILINNVSNAQELSVLPILGIGGLGKTTLAQMVFKDERVIEHFHPKIWVCVSDDFDEKRLIKAIVEFIEGKSLGDMDLAPLQIKLGELLIGKIYFLVLDDVWNEDQQKWDNLRSVLNVGASGASVLTTTRLEKVGSIMGTLRRYKLSNLSEEDCWSVFRQRAFEKKEEISPNLETIGKEIVKKCGGVPLAAKTLGSLLRFEREERDWENVRDSEIWNLRQDENSIMPALRLSSRHLPPDSRRCFAYCATFLKDTKMEKENLITLWMAHGYLEREDVGNKVWNELYLRSFFQEIEVKFGKTYFKMHDLIHDLATSLFSTGTSSSNTREINVDNYDMSIGFAKVVSIGFAKVVPSCSPLLLKKHVSLRVLNLSCSILEQLPSSIGDLIHLRYLDLSRNHNIRSLPKRLCKLQNLQTLDLHDCGSLCCLPKQTSKLVSLQNLLLDSCNGLTSTPPRIGALTCLKSLAYFFIGKRKGYQLGELKNLDLHGPISIKHLERVKNETEAKEANLSAKTNLQSLSMCWDGDEPHRYESEEVKVLEALKPHPNLNSLEIIGFRGLRFPNWINHTVLERVVSIRISSCKNCSRLSPFGELPCLEILVLEFGSAEVGYVEEDYVNSGFRFPSLRKLEISDFSNLKGLLKNVGAEQFPVLEDMVITYCPMFVFPTISYVKELRICGKVDDAAGLSSISNLSTLTSLKIHHMYEATSIPEEMFKGLVNLKSLEIFDLHNLKELPTSMASLNALEDLVIRSCPTLESLPEGLLKTLGEEQFPVLEKMVIENCPMFVFPTISSVKEFRICGKVDDAAGLRSISNLSTLTSLEIGYMHEATSLPEEMFKGLANLKSLKIFNLYNLKELPTSMASLHALEDLEIVNCPALVSLSKGLLKTVGEEQLPVLEKMTISNCPMFVFQTLSSVKKVIIFLPIDAAGLSSISNLSALTSLWISQIHKATSLPEEMFNGLANLKFLAISGLDNLKELPTSMASLNALEDLVISYCPALESLPEGLKHLKALTKFRVYQCPTVTKRCEKGIGQDWHKIAHITRLDIW